MRVPIRALAVLVLALIPAAAAIPAGAASSPVAVVRGNTPDTSIFPSDQWTVADGAQLTGRRVSLPMPACDSTNYSICDGTRMLNTLDGFDLRPRVTVPFSGPIDVTTVTDRTVFIEGPRGFRTGLTQVVWDPRANVLAGLPVDYLVQDQRYTVVVTGGVRDAHGQSVHACGGTCRVTFTTLSGTTELQAIRAALDDGSAYRAAGITPAGRAAGFTQNGVRTVFPAATVTEIDRLDQVNADPAKPLASSTVLNTAIAGAGYYAFGYFDVPRYLNSDYVIPQVPTRQTPQPAGRQRVGFDLIVPAGVAPAGGWPVAIFGPGFTRSKYDLFLAADLNAARGIATIATDPTGHGYGPLSKTTVKQGPAATTFLSFGQGVDLDGDGTIDASEGVQPSDHKTYDASGRLIADVPSHFALAGLRDGLIQTVVNDMALVRMLEAGVDVLGDGTVTLARHGVTYYGQSFGGIYGTMLMGTDTHLSVGVLNVPGGPITEIARLSGFRNLLADQLRVNRPNLLNGGPGLNGFTEDMPLRGEPAVNDPHPGATTIAHYLADANWYERAGTPETFAPLLRLAPAPGAPIKHVIFQTAFGDHTVPNPTAGELYRAGRVFDLVTYYRNDKAPTYQSDPHGFLLDPRLAGRNMGQAQVLAYLSSGGSVVLDPDGPGPVFEVPIQNRRNLDCLHYPQPQTGQPFTFSSGEC